MSWSEGTPTYNTWRGDSSTVSRLPSGESVVARGRGRPSSRPGIWSCKSDEPSTSSPQPSRPTRPREEIEDCQLRALYLSRVIHAVTHRFWTLRRREEPRRASAPKKFRRLISRAFVALPRLYSGCAPGRRGLFLHRGRLPGRRSLLLYRGCLPGRRSLLLHRGRLPGRRSLLLYRGAFLPGAVFFFTVVVFLADAAFFFIAVAFLAGSLLLYRGCLWPFSSPWSSSWPTQPSSLSRLPSWPAQSFSSVPCVSLPR